jgi:hypothetical protein
MSEAEAAMADDTAVIEEPARAEPVAAPPATPPAEPAAAAADGKKDAKAKKGAKAEEGKKGKGAKDAGQSGGGAPSIAAHPRAARGVATAKAWGAVAGFALGGYLSLPTHTLADAGMRALLAGVICWVAAWAGAVFVWRRLVILEIKGREQQLLAGVQAGASGSAGEPPRVRPEG